MREIELKAVVPDAGAVRTRLVAAGAVCVFAGSMTDRLYDTAENALSDSDHVLRLRVRRPAAGQGAPGASLDWKGPTRRDGGYKEREELSAAVVEGDATDAVLRALGYSVTMEIDREIELFELGGAVVRIEQYPRLDVLIEVEGEPDAIERAIKLMGIPRAAFSPNRLVDFVADYERRTGARAAISQRELSGDYRFLRSRA
jgi:adenylate cyclase class IV